MQTLEEFLEPLQETLAQIKSAIDSVKQAQELVSDIQSQEVFGSPRWHALETVDDRLHDALSKLGD